MIEADRSGLSRLTVPELSSCRRFGIRSVKSTFLGAAMSRRELPSLNFLFLVIMFKGVYGVVEETMFQNDGLPFFVSVPTVVKTTENDTVVLPCYVENLGDNRVQWWRGDLLLADSNGSLSLVDRIRMGPDNGLEVATVIADDTGEYECRVDRPSPYNPLVQKHAIEVLYNPTVSLSPPGPVIDVAIGQDVVIECDAYAYPTPIVKWIHQGNVPEDSRVLSGFLHQLNFKAISRRQSGLYTCTADNGVGNPVSATVRLRILHAPEISVEKEWVHASPGVRAELTCIVVSEPPAKVEWTRGKHPVAIPQRISRKANGVAREAVIKSDPASANENGYTLIWEAESYTPIINFKLEFRRVKPDEPSNWTEVVIPADGASALVHSKSFSLGGLSPASSYEAMIWSRNAYGWSPPSEVFCFSTRGADNQQSQITDDVISRSDDAKLENDEVEVDTQQVVEKAAVILAQPKPHWSHSESTTLQPSATSTANWDVLPAICLILIAFFMSVC